MLAIIGREPATAGRAMVKEAGVLAILLVMLSVPPASQHASQRNRRRTNARSCPCRRPCPYLYRLCLSLFLSALASIPAAPTVLLHSVLIVAKVFDRVEAFGKLIAISETVHNHWLPRKD